MSTQAERYDLATAPTFLRRVEVNIAQFAKTVLAEAADVTGHALRVDLATAVLADSAGYARRFALLLVSDPSVEDTAPYGNGLTDAELDGAVQYAWNPMAGVHNT